MKRVYEKPAVEIEKFESVDVITTSGGGDEPIVTPPDWGDYPAYGGACYAPPYFVIKIK